MQCISGTLTRQLVVQRHMDGQTLLVYTPYRSLKRSCCAGYDARCANRRGLSQPSGRAGPQDVEAVVLQLEKLLGDVLDAMPRLRPVRGRPVKHR